MVRSRAVPISGSDATAEDALCGCSVWGEMDSLQAQWEVEMLCDGADVEGSHEMFRVVNTKELSAPSPLMLIGE